MKLVSYTLAGKKGKEVDSGLFDNAGHVSLVSQAVRVYLANQRAGTAKTKTRGEVDMTKKKVYKQKHTGNARHGARSAPIFVGGGVTHGPHGNASWSLSMSKQMRKRALETALSLQAQADRVKVLSGLEDLKGKTKEIVSIMSALELTDKAVLMVVDTVTDTLLRAVGNVGAVFVCDRHDLGSYQIRLILERVRDQLDRACVVHP